MILTFVEEWPWAGARDVTVSIPRRLAEELEKRGMDVETSVVDLLMKALNLDPEVGVDAHLELALKYLDEGRSLVDKDPVQASGKLYKAAEEVVKALATHFNLSDILEDVAKSGRWSVTRLWRSVLRISDKLGEWFMHSWNSAWVLHVWGFHEAKFGPEDVKRLLPYVERMALEARKVVGGGR
jgi:hypothetical protein